MTDIKSGFLIKVHSWENDWDNHNTVSLDGLTVEQVRFYVDFCNLFKSVNDHKNPGKFGNAESTTESINELNYLGHQLALKHNFYDEDFYEGADFWDLQYVVIGTSEYGYWRVCEKVEVFYVPEIIKDVTETFKVTE